MGDFDCTRPDDGTALLTCCQELGTDTPCVQIGGQYKLAYFPHRVFINVNSCRMFLRKKEYWYFTNPDFPLGWRDRTTTATYRVGSTAQLVDTTWTSDIAAGLPLPTTRPWNFYDFTRNDVGYSYKFNYGSTVHTITVTFENEISFDELQARHVALENYVVGNFGTLGGLAYTYGLNYQILRYTMGTSSVLCGTTQLVPPIAGYARSIYRVGGAIDLTEKSDTDWNIAEVSQYSWFAKGRLTRNYRVTEYAIAAQGGRTPELCGAQWLLAPFSSTAAFGSTQSRFDCTQTRSVLFGDGFDQNGNPREVLFGPTSRTPHITTVACRTA